jgi:hypothetical protein
MTKTGFGFGIFVIGICLSFGICYLEFLITAVLEQQILVF